MDQATVLLLSARDLLPELVQVPFEELQAVLALLLLRPGLFSLFLQEQPLLLHLEHEVSVALKLLLLLGLDCLQEHDLLLVDRQLILKAIHLLHELFDLRLLNPIADPIPVGVAEQ